MAGYKPELAFQPYIAPQQASPVEEFNNLGTVLNERYDKNIAKWDELDAYTNQLQLNEQDSIIKESALQDTRNILKEIREKGNWENAKLQVREVAKRLVNDSALTIAQQNFKRSQEQKDTESKMRMQGHTLVDFNLGRFNQTTIDPKTGKARVLDYASTEKLQDYDARRKSIFEGITADGYSREGSSPTIDPKTGAIYQIGSASSASYVSADKVKQIAVRNLDNYLATPEGQQELRVLTSTNSMNGQPMEIGKAKQEILNKLINTGLTRTFSQTSNKQSTSISDPGTLGGRGRRGGGKNDEQVFTLIDKVEMSDETPSYGMGRTELEDVVKAAYNNKDTNKKEKAKWELNSMLDNLENNPDKKVASTATEYKNFINDVYKTYGKEDGEAFIASHLAGKKDHSYLYNEKVNKKQEDALYKRANQLKSKTNGFIFDTKFEDVVEEQMNKKVALNVGWVTPDYAKISSTKASQLSKAMENYSLDNFDIVRGADKNLDNLKDRKVTITRLSNGPVGGGKGVGFIIRDSEGQEHIAVPKANGYGNQIVQQFAEAFDAPDLIIKDKFAKGVNKIGDSRPLSSVFKDNNLPSNSQMDGMSIKKTETGFNLMRNGKPITLNEKIQGAPLTDRGTLTKIAQDAINDGIVTSKDVIKGQDNFGFIIDERKLLEAIKKSNKPHNFKSQYDIYGGFL